MTCPYCGEALAVSDRGVVPEETSRGEYWIVSEERVECYSCGRPYTRRTVYWLDGRSWNRKPSKTRRGRA